MRAGLPVLTFADADAFASWLETHGASSAGAWLKFAKKGAPVPTLAKAEALDAALCHGWIDGQIGRYNAHYWVIRFTARQPASRWSQINCERASALMAEGRMRLEGLDAVASAKADGRWAGAYAPASRAEPPPDLVEALKANPKAAAFFATLKGANRYALLYRIHAVKKPETRARKIASYVEMLERGETIHG
ncbi:MAG: YdeI/OmpD-associated family protein [Hyphomicrobiales bacterium]|nr:YdeI/OmpD-associated family protein [Hyphomicrobiales bacterium]